MYAGAAGTASDLLPEALRSYIPHTANILAWTEGKKLALPPSKHPSLVCLEVSSISHKQPLASPPILPPPMLEPAPSIPQGAKVAIQVESVFRHPSTLRLFLRHTTWDDFHAFTSTCRDLRYLVTQPELKDIILACYVRGYRRALFGRDPLRYKDVQFDMHDLALFMVSQSLPLHQFPMHALLLLGYYQHPTPTELDWQTTRYIALTQAHSRSILLLRSLVHSSSTPAPLEDRVDAAGLQTYPPGVRELVFPAPLSYFDGHEGEKSAGLSHQPSRSTMPPTPSNPSTSSRLTRSTARADDMVQDKPPTWGLSRRSFLGGPKVPLPPPESVPVSIQRYSVLRKPAPSSLSPGMRKFSSVSDHSVNGSFKLPQRRFASANVSSASSLESAGHSPPGFFSRTPTSHRGDTSPPLAPTTSPHDITQALVRTRAPLLWVFAPCTALDELAITLCEEQLMDAGLWEHMSCGDIVCNLGYVPPPEPESNSSSPCTGPDGEQTKHRKKWLVFNGYCLVHFIPPAPPPVENSLSLPSPFYYCHILPPLANPIHMLSLLPLSRMMAASFGQPITNNTGFQLTLVHLPTRVLSPQSPMGYAVVKKYSWVARVTNVGPFVDDDGSLGEGWYGEWILEAEGTKEGRRALLDAIQIGPDGQCRRGLWQVIREKCDKGKLWMRLLSLEAAPTDIRSAPASSSH